MRSKFAWLPAVAFLFSVPLRAADDPAPATEEATAPRHTLRYQFAPDQVLRYAKRNTSTIDAQAGQYAEVVEQDSTMTPRYRVKSIDASGTVDLDVVIERVQLEATAGDDTIKYDSDKPGEVPESLQGIQGTIGKSRGTLRLAPYYKHSRDILEVFGMLLFLLMGHFC